MLTKEICNLIQEYGKDEVVQELLEIVEENSVFDRYTKGWSMSQNFKPELDSKDMDLGTELSIMDRAIVLRDIVWDDKPYIISYNGWKLELEMTILPNNKVDIGFGGLKLRGGLKTDFIVMWINKYHTQVEPMGIKGDWEQWYVEIEGQRLIVGFGPKNLSSIQLAKAKYYDRLVREDGSRRTKHRYVNLNTELEKKHEVYGDQSLMLGSMFDDEVFNAYQEAKEIVEIYERKL